MTVRMTQTKSGITTPSTTPYPAHPGHPDLSELAGTFVPGSTHLATIPNAPAHAQQFLDLASGQATVLAFADASLLIAGACFISVALVFLMPHPRRGAVKGKRR